jgi:hypothetical protein
MDPTVALEKQRLIVIGKPGMKRLSCTAKWQSGDSQPVTITHHDTFSTTIQPPYSYTTG